MRIKKLVEAILTEAARFGSNEKNLILQRANEFKIGIEYEFEVNEEYVEGFQSAPSRDEIIDIVSYNVEQNYQAEISGVVRDFHDAAIDIHNGRRFADLKARLDAHKTDFEQESTTEEEFLSEMHGIYVLANEINGMELTKYVDEFSEGSFNSVTNSPQDYMDALEGLGFPVLDDAEITVTSPSSINDFDSLWNKLDYLENTYFKIHNLTPPRLWNLVSSIDHDLQLVDNVRDPIEQTAIDDYLDGVVDDDGVGNYTATEWVKNNLPSDLQQYIEDIVEDPSLTHGAEVVTKPLPIDDTFTVMDRMFSFISDHGYTNNETGMHVNISHKSFSQNTPINALKTVILLDPSFLQHGNSKLGKWKERNITVRDIISTIDTPQIILSLAGLYASNRDIEAVEDVLGNLLVKREKFRSINFTSFLQSSGNSTRRIEFRLFGSQGYEGRFDEAMNDILFTCYTVLAGADRDFLRKEYLVGMVRLLNKLSMKHHNQDFVSLANAIAVGKIVI